MAFGLICNQGITANMAFDLICTPHMVCEIVLNHVYMMFGNPSKT